MELIYLGAEGIYLGAEGTEHRPPSNDLNFKQGRALGSLYGTRCVGYSPGLKGLSVRFKTSWYSVEEDAFGKWRHV